MSSCAMMQGMAHVMSCNVRYGDVMHHGDHRDVICGYGTSCHAVSCHVVRCVVMPCDMMWCDVVGSCHVISCGCDILECHAMLCECWCVSCRLCEIVAYAAM